MIERNNLKDPETRTVEQRFDAVWGCLSLVCLWLAIVTAVGGAILYGVMFAG
jgi:hypothetical protein